MVIEFVDGTVEFDGGEVTVTKGGVKSYKGYDGYESRPTAARLKALKKLPVDLGLAMKEVGVQLCR